MGVFYHVGFVGHTVLIRLQEENLSKEKPTDTEEGMLIFQVDKLENNKIVHSYKIYSNGDTEGFGGSGDVRYLINNHLPNQLRKRGLSMSDVFPL